VGILQEILHLRGHFGMRDGRTLRCSNVPGKVVQFDRSRLPIMIGREGGEKDPPPGIANGRIADRSEAGAMMRVIHIARRQKNGEISC